MPLAYVLEDFGPDFAYVLEDLRTIFAYVLEILCIFAVELQMFKDDTAKYNKSASTLGPKKE